MDHQARMDLGINGFQFVFSQKAETSIVDVRSLHFELFGRGLV